MNKALMDIKKEINVEFNKICFRSCSDCVYKENEYVMGCAIDFATDYLNSKNMLNEPKVDWAKVEVDTKVIVKKEVNCNYLKRHFATFKNGKVYVFRYGATSHSADKNNSGHITHYEITKLYEEGEE